MVESYMDFSDKERSKYWWSDNEKNKMLAKHERLVAKYEQEKFQLNSGSNSNSGSKKRTSSLLQDNNHRGLESWTTAGSLKLDHTIEQCITAVMDEQDRQWRATSRRS